MSKVDRKRILVGALKGTLMGLLLLFMFGIFCAVVEEKNWSNMSIIEVIGLSAFSGVMAVIYYGIVCIPVAAFTGAWISGNILRDNAPEFNSQTNESDNH